MGKIIAIIIVIALGIGAWYIFSQASDTATPSHETVNEPINQAHDLEDKANNSPARGTTTEE